MLATGGMQVVEEAAAMVGERLEAEICLLAAHDAALSYRRLVFIAEFDRRELAGSWGMVSTAAWLSWRTALDGRTAREQVRVARALASLPVVGEAMERGELTYSKVRALTRFATAGTEADLVELARHTTASQLDMIAATWVRGQEAERSAHERAEQATVRTWGDGPGMQIIWARLPTDDAAVVMRAIEAFGETAERGSAEPDADDGDADASVATTDDSAGGSAEPRDDADGDDEWVAASAVAGEEGGPVLIDGVWVYPDDDDGDDEHERVDDRGGSAEPVGPSGAAVAAAAGAKGRRLAAGLVALSEAALSGGGGELCRDRFLVNVFADLSVLDGTAGEGEQLNLLDTGAAISSATVRRLACSEPLVLIVNDKDGNPLYMGRKTRFANRRQRRAALARSNGQCAFPGCERQASLQIHHTDPWGDGGHTNIDKLVPQCRYHHFCLHEGGFRVEPSPGGFRFFTPDGREIVEAPPLLDELSVRELASRLREPVRAAASPWAGSGEKIDLDCTMSAVGSLFAREERNRKKAESETGLDEVA